MSMNPDLKPVGSTRSHTLRKERLGRLTGSLDYRYFATSAFFTPEATRDTMEGTQFEGENHRRITPYVQELFDRGGLIEKLDYEAKRDTFKLFSGYSTLAVPTYDVAIIGSGPHGGAVAAYLREKHPELKSVIIEANDVLGGQWRSYGPKPVFQMNSRVRKADRRLPALPRTQGSINPLGIFAPMELSDMPTGIYPWNTDMGNVCAINAFLSADVAVQTKVRRVDETYLDGAYVRELSLTTPFGNRYMIARLVVDATGLTTGSSRVASFSNGIPDGYFTTRTFYEHFARQDNPLERFHGAKVMVIGAGDSALTVLEALIGNLPAETYGRAGVGRTRPARIDWLGARSAFPEQITGCLRSRYKNGISQSLRRAANDEAGMIVPNDDQVSYVTRRDDEAFFEAITFNRGTMFPNIVVDCTNYAEEKFNSSGWQVNYFVGPNSGQSFPDRTTNKIRELGINENNVSLWATMQLSDRTAADIGRAIA